MSRQLDYVTLDVFTEERLRGNPLAVVELPHDATITQEEKQLIAREFNFSETAFLHLNADGTASEWDFDIFMTDRELPFAGHPTIGTIWHCANYHLPKEEAGQNLGDVWTPITLNARAGKIEAAYNRETGFARASIPQEVRVHAATFRKADLLTAQPGLVPHSGIDEEFPVVSIVKGMTFALVEVPDLDALGAVSPPQANPDVALDKGWDAGLVATCYFSRVSESSASSTVDVLRVRMIAGQIEDPATGSACSALGSYLALQKKRAGEFRFVITQGVEMRRKSEIVVAVTLTEEGKVGKVVLEGKTVLVMKGKIEF